jgi:hypothetical protein
LTRIGARRITDAVADPASSSAETGPKARPVVLVAANDFSLAAAKTSRHLALALNALGYNAIVRDTRLTRWAAAAVEAESATRREAYENAVVAKWTKLVDDYGIDYIVSLDLHWLLSSRLFLGPADRVRKVHSFWFDDLRSHLLSAPMFPLDPRAAMNAPKVAHHCYGAGQAEELRLLGVTNVSRSALAAPAGYLRADAACEQTGKLAFVGNPWKRWRPWTPENRSPRCARSPGAKCSTVSHPQNRPRAGCGRNRACAI